MEDIILVTGTHCTRSCTNVAFPGGQDDAQVSFGAKVDRSGDAVVINWQFSHEKTRGVVLNDGPEGEVRPYGTLCWQMNPDVRVDRVRARTCRRISAFSYEGFALLVCSRYCPRGLREQQDPIQTQMDTTRSQTRNLCRYQLYRR
jgi:hypothetical protein